MNAWFDRKEMAYDSMVTREEIDRTLATVLRIVEGLEKEVHN